ncbi:MAG: hypothetical protein HPY55_12375 [Firmicutes bacterium]|nr:hypothetical protein [Bacillota bacterium]
MRQSMRQSKGIGGLPFAGHAGPSAAPSRIGRLLSGADRAIITAGVVASLALSPMTLPRVEAGSSISSATPGYSASVRAPLPYRSSPVIYSGVIRGGYQFGGRVAGRPVVSTPTPPVYPDPQPPVAPSTLAQPTSSPGGAGAGTSTQLAGAAPSSGPATEVSRPAAGIGEVFAYCPVDYPGDPSGYVSLKAHASKVHTAAAFLYGIDASGRPYGEDDQRLFALQKAAGFNLVAVVHNFRNGNFDPEVVRPSLVTLEGRARAAGAITDLVLSKGYSGVNIDFEGLTPDLRTPFSLFIKNLAGRLHHHGRTVSIAVPAKTRDIPGDAWSGAFDYTALANDADRLVIMAYDQHWVNGPAGPIASIGWVDKVAAYAANAAPPEKVLLGVPQYAYDWPDAGGPAMYITTPRAMQIAAETGAEILWDNAAQVPHFYYWRGSEKRHVYMENSYSLAFKLKVARSRGLGGIAIWRLGYEDPLIWSML